MRSIRLLVAFVVVSALTFAVQAQTPDGLRWSGNAFPSSASTPTPHNRGLMKSTDSLHSATNAVAWHDGAIAWTSHNECISGLVEYETGQYVGWYADTANPKVGDIYYVHVVVSTVGNACVGTYANVELLPPPSTYLAISQTNPVFCYYTNPQGVTTQNTANCPQSLSNGLYGYSLNPVASTTPWPLALGSTIEIQVPVFSTAVMSGIATSTYLGAYVQAIDGAYNPTATPSLGQFVYPNPPSITYPSPSSGSITNTTVRNYANVLNHYVTGSVYFDIGSTTAYGTSTPPATIPAVYNSVAYYQDWGSLTPGTLYHWRARLVTGSGTTLGADQTFTTTGTVPPPSVRGDFDGNGTTDILWRSYISGTNALWMMTGLTKTSIVVLDTIGDPSWKIVGLGDFNGDGKTDILWRSYPSGNNAIWYMNGTVKTSVALIEALPDPAWRIEGVGDFNGDGKPDILWRNYVSGTNALWLMNGAVKSSIVVLDPIADAGWKIVGTGDFNGDGKTDILWRNYSSGTNAVWLMNGTVKTSVVVLDPINDPAWKMVGTGDFNGDGQTDILWRNYISGTNAVWLMNGTVKTSVVVLDPLFDATWKIQGIGEFETNGTER
jgi:hypothetical protein